MQSVCLHLQIKNIKLLNSVFVSPIDHIHFLCNYLPGITDLYVHVAVDNEAAKKLYDKSGFSYESEEPAWRARFLGRPQRYLLWTDLGKTN